MKTNAVVDPWAMMIHLQNTSAANAAMVAAIRLVLATPLAVSSVAGLLRLLQKRPWFPFTAGYWDCHAVLPIRIVGNLPGMSDNGAKIANEQHDCHDVEDCAISHTLSPEWLVNSGALRANLQHRRNVAIHEDAPETTDGGKNENHGNKLGLFVEPGSSRPLLHLLLALLMDGLFVVLLHRGFFTSAARGEVHLQMGSKKCAKHK